MRHHYEDELGIKLEPHANLINTTLDLALKDQSYEKFLDFLNLDVQLLPRDVNYRDGGEVLRRLLSRGRTIPDVYTA